MSHSGKTLCPLPPFLLPARHICLSPRLSLSRLPHSVHTKVTPQPPSRPHLATPSPSPPSRVHHCSALTSAVWAWYCKRAAWSLPRQQGFPHLSFGSCLSAPPPGTQSPPAASVVWPPLPSSLASQHSCLNHWAPATWLPCHSCSHLVPIVLKPLNRLFPLPGMPFFLPPPPHQLTNSSLTSQLQHHDPSPSPRAGHPS